jgi:hypothetical protein
MWPERRIVTDLQYTVSTLVIFIGAIVVAAEAYLAARGDASSPETKDLRLISIAPCYAPTFCSGKLIFSRVAPQIPFRSNP